MRGWCYDVDLARAGRDDRRAGCFASVSRLHSCPGARDPGTAPSISERKPTQKRSSLCVVRMVAEPAQQPSGIPSTFRD
jgi:hypothetical protein